VNQGFAPGQYHIVVPIPTQNLDIPIGTQTMYIGIAQLFYMQCSLRDAQISVAVRTAGTLWHQSTALFLPITLSALLKLSSSIPSL
jgi:hypothetical protein